MTVPMPPWEVLDAAGLTILESTRDGLAHLVDEVHYATEIGSPSTGSLPKIISLCNRELVVGALVGGPCPDCDGCARAAAPRLAETTRRRRARELSGGRPSLLARVVEVARLRVSTHASSRRHRSALTG